jgi:uncharacterized protein DUF6791/ThiF family protein
VFQKLVSHNDDIRRLVEKKYAVGFDSNYLIVRDVPYLDNKRELRIGAIVTKLVFVNQEKVVQDDHQIFFAGGVPHGLDGQPIQNLGGNTCGLTLSEAAKDVVVERSFSNKPKVTEKFADFFEKIESYVSIISGPAIELHGANPYTCRVVESAPSDSVFKFHDTLTSRAEITDLSAELKNDVVAIIGLGGTGGFLLDFLVKTPVREIRGFDGDLFYVHNAFRSPGLLQEAELGRPKAEVFQGRYENFRTGLSLQTKYIDASSAADLDGVTFAFVCVDKGSSRAAIFELLISKGIPFIDVGMGLKRKQERLNGMVRTTLYSAEDGERVRAKGLAELKDQPDDLYRANIQIGELNALNAVLAIIRFKQLRGFYFEEISYYHLLFEIGDLKVVGSDNLDED